METIISLKDTNHPNFIGYQMVTNKKEYLFSINYDDFIEEHKTIEISSHLYEKEVYRLVKQSELIEIKREDVDDGLDIIIKYKKDNNINEFVITIYNN
jgi:hypothetical protein